MLGTHPTDLLVIGAGPVGLAAAYAAIGRGLRARIVDRSVRTAVHAYCALLHPQTVHLLESFGFADELARRGRMIRAVRVRAPGAEPVEMSLERIHERGARICALPQSELEEMLESGLRDHRTPVHWNHEATDIRLNPDGVVVRLCEYGEIPHGYPTLSIQRLVVREHFVAAGWVLGADGYHSAVRRFANLGVERTRDARRFLFFEAELDRELPPVVDIAFAPGGRTSIWPMRENWCRWTFECDRPAQGVAAEEMLRALVAERAPWFDGAVRRVRWSGSGLFEVCLPLGLARDRMVIAGDAAHLGDPIGAQSMNAGLQEACEVVESIADVVQGASAEAAIRRYEEHAMRRWRDAVRSKASWPGDVPHWVATHGDQLVASMPILGKAREELLLQLGLEPTY